MRIRHPLWGGAGVVGAAKGALIVGVCAGAKVADPAIAFRSD